MSTFVETEHPRDRVGKFTDKEHSAPEATLAVPNASFNDIKDRDERVAAMNEELLTAVEDLADDAKWQGYLNTMSKFHRYSLNNQLLISLQRPDATKVTSFKKWKEMGRTIRKGERGIAIFAPMLVADKDANGNLRYDSDGRVIKKYVKSLPTSVFDISQTEGDPLPESEWERDFTEEPPEGFADDLTRAIEAQGYEVRFEDLSGQSARGYTRNHNGEKLVVIDSSQSPGTQATTLAHELGHIACGHMEEDRRGEYHTGHGGNRGGMEVEAESFAYVLARANGMQAHLRGASEYVAGWAGKSPEELRETGATVQKAVKGALTGNTWRNAVL